MAKISVKLETRKITGRKVKSLRRQGILPINIYGKNIKSVSAQLDLQQFNKILDQAGETNLIYVTLNSEKSERPCLISHIQTHPVTGLILHVDFHQVDLTEKVNAEIPVELTGEAPAVSLENATIVTQISAIEVEALPTDLPEKFSIDISKLEKVGDSIKISDLNFNKDKIKIALDPETVVISTQAQAAEEVVETTPSTTETEEEPSSQEETPESTETETKETSAD